MVGQEYPTLGFCKNKLRKYTYVFSTTPGSWQILNNCSLSFFSNTFIAASALCWSSVLFHGLWTYRSVAITTTLVSWGSRAVSDVEYVSSEWITKLTNTWGDGWGSVHTIFHLGKYLTDPLSVIPRWDGNYLPQYGEWSSHVSSKGTPFGQISTARGASLNLQPRAKGSLDLNAKQTD